MKVLSDLIPEYIEESHEYLRSIEEDFILMEQGKHDYESIDRVSRVIRSIKGGASFLGLSNIEKLSRKIEKIFNLIRNNDLEFSPQITAIILNAITKLKEILVNAGTNDGSDINVPLPELDACIQDKTLPISLVKWEDIDISLVLGKYTFETLKKQNKKIFYLQFELREVQYESYNSPLEFFQEIEKTGDIIELKVDMELVLENDSFTGEGIPLCLIYATGLEKEIVAYIFGIDESQVMELEGSAIYENKVENRQEIQKSGREGEDNEESIEKSK
ncbi:MAG TPA: Hpt domain-containing protein [Candidatus Kapabacteria bacterium]|nr:Hpt domain-containing protein [Candidatus Kapabacteria bacterium]